MKIRTTAINGVAVIETAAVEDARGRFARLFCDEALAPLLAGRHIAQINHSCTVGVGALRGLHYQRAPRAEMKFVRCLRGRVFDVALDLRAGSPTFLHWHAEELAPDSMRMLVIPEGCAHGFQTLEADSELLYLHTAPYAPEAEGGVRWDEPRAAIRWPLPASDLSARDRAHPWLAAGFTGLAP
jgi:dTDP-4-dehydrorhamnose 3,5-epimerase